MESARIFRPALVGRDQPLRDLRDALAHVHERGRLILVSGEPGIGKTRLAEEAEAMARAHAIRVFWGRCHEMDGHPPFWPWIQILRAYALEAGPAEVATTIEPDMRPLAQLVPELRPHLDGLGVPVSADSESARFRLFLGLTALLRRAAAPGAMLLVLDDVHWADLPSLRLLEFLSHQISEAPIVVVVTFRDVDLQASPGASEVVGGLVRRAQQIALAGLSGEEAARFVANLGTQPLPEAWTKRLHEITEGNPFFLDEMVRWLETCGDPPGSSPQSLPQGVLATIRQRLKTLADDVVDLVAGAAVCGRDVDIGLLEAVLEVSRVELLERLRPAIERNILRQVRDRPGRLRFSHALMREALHAELPARRRVELHWRCAATLESRTASRADAPVSEIAHHYYEAAMHGHEAKALEYAERAAEQAMSALAFEEAITHFGRVLHLLEMSTSGDPAHTCEILLRLGEAANRAAQGPESMDAYRRAADLARRVGSPQQLARAAIGLCGVGSTWAQYGRSDPSLITALQEALEALPDDELGLRARVLARLASELHFAPTRVDSEALSAEAVALARRAGDAATLMYTLPARLRCSYPEQREERGAIVEELLQLTGRRGELAVHAYAWQLSEAVQAGALSDTDAIREAMVRALQELQQPRDLWLIAALQSQRHLLEGRLADAERGAEAILGHDSLSPNGQMAALVLLFLIRREQGRLDELAAGMRNFAAQSTIVTAWRTTLAQLYAETGDLSAARGEVDQLVDEGLTCLRRDNTWLLAVSGLAMATALSGTAEQAAMVYRALHPFDGRYVVAASFYFVGPVAYYLGALALRQGQGEVAVRHFEAAANAARSLGALPALARSLMGLSRAIEVTAANESSSANETGRDAHDEAMQLAARLGLGGLSLRFEPAADRPPAAPSLPSASDRVAELSRKGEAWQLTYNGRVSILKARRGLDYLVCLLEAPDRMLHVLELASPGSGSAAESEAEVVLDPRAKRELRARLEDLQEELQEAEGRQDRGRAEKARAEIDAITEHLAMALGLGGRDRRAVSATDRARAAVTKALRSAIRQIEAVEPDLAALLDRTVHTGILCSYTPLREASVRWSIER